MKITWYGQSSFGIQSSTGILVVTDPYDPELAGFKTYPDKANIVIKSSSNDAFHDQDHLVPKKDGAIVIDALVLALGDRETSSHGITVSAIEAMEHSNHPSGDPDQNAMYRFDVDGLKIGHMGDMGNDFSDAQITFFKGVDILIGHAGGFPVISLTELDRVVKIVKPKIVIPMHFRTLCYKPKDMHFITEFLKLFPDDKTDFACSCTASISAATLPDETRALVLDNY